ncbi:MAG TPA: hypothetical protein VFU35_08760, partial [Jatrophihabitans sp.]|nr:hypothetical protein [Jatrophihabitans sp.]
MSEVGPAPGTVVAAAPQPAAERGGDLLVAGVVIAVLAVLGALLGLVWSAWSPPGPTAIVLGGGVFQVIDETENQIAADGRFLLIVSAVG